MTRRYTFITDPGHGWLEVPLKELVELGIADKISGYSYRHGDNAYLEEDCDAPLFIDAMRSRGLCLGDGIGAANSDIAERYEENTPIRNYAPYAPRRR